MWGFHTAYNMSIAQGSKKVLEDFPLNSDFLEVLKKPKTVEAPRVYIDTVIQWLSLAKAKYKRNARLLNVKLPAWPKSLLQKPTVPTFDNSVDCPAPATSSTSGPSFDSYTTTVIVNVLLTVSDMDEEDEDSVLHRTQKFYKLLIKIAGRSEKIKKRSSQTRKYIILQTKESLSS